MKTQYIIAALLLLATIGSAQSTIALQHGETLYTHTRLDTIIEHAQDGDDIYLPGGNIILTSHLTINKKLNIYGAGHYPDSTKATSVSFVSGGNIYFTTTASGSTLSGIYLYNDMLLSSTSTDSTQLITISRCNISTLYFGTSAVSRNTACSNMLITENVIRGNIYGADAQNCLVSKNIINGQTQYFNGNAFFKHNIFTYQYHSYDVFRNCTGVNLDNNIFTRDYHGLNASQINNNLFVLNISAEPGGTNIGFGNIGGEPVDSIFMSYSGAAFSYDDNYQLKENCSGKAAANDGTDIGIYGSDDPYKPYAVPSNPHIRLINIANRTSQGKLPVEIHVSAQDK